MRRRWIIPVFLALSCGTSSAILLKVEVTDNVLAPRPIDCVKVKLESGRGAINRDIPLFGLPPVAKRTLKLLVKPGKTLVEGETVVVTANGYIGGCSSATLVATSTIGQYHFEPDRVPSHTLRLARDEDQDKYPLPDDCDDTNGTTHPGATECCDGVDNDCDPDGQIDEGCSTTCGVTSPTETSCSNNIDEDGDGKIDCADIDGCPDGAACGPGCVCLALAKHELPTHCHDGLDNDGDNKPDCADNDCTGVPANAAQPAQNVCCPNAPAPGKVDLSSDEANCGGCGIVCNGGPNADCRAVEIGGIPVAGVCRCSDDPPTLCPDETTTRQDCRGDDDDGRCSCQGINNACAPGQTCVVVGGGAAADYCRYQ
jgi:hypothetical protein